MISDFATAKQKVKQRRNKKTMLSTTSLLEVLYPDDLVDHLKAWYSGDSHEQVMATIYNSLVTERKLAFSLTHLLLTELISLDPNHVTIPHLNKNQYTNFRMETLNHGFENVLPARKNQAGVWAVSEGHVLYGVIQNLLKLDDSLMAKKYGTELELALAFVQYRKPEIETEITPMRKSSFSKALDYETEP